MHRLLVLFAHPALQRSRVNARLVETARQVPGVTVHDLYEAYPDLFIDVQREKELLLAHDVIVFQHPFYWYSTPSILKEWQDLVLEHGWAYGKGGTALQGKVAINAITTGAPQEAYRTEGRNRFTMRQLLSPFDQTAYLCGMRYLAPFVVHKSLAVAGPQDVVPHSALYRCLLESLRDGRLDLEAAAAAERVNDVLGSASGTSGAAA